tara:strand:- start:697 stop:1962 length:1266 start_codon:yes stop_codon:yes gene_type:complete
MELKNRKYILCIALLLIAGLLFFKKELFIGGKKNTKKSKTKKSKTKKKTPVVDIESENFDILDTSLYQTPEDILETETNLETEVTTTKKLPKISKKTKQLIKNYKNKLATIDEINESNELVTYPNTEEVIIPEIKTQSLITNSDSNIILSNKKFKNGNIVKILNIEDNNIGIIINNNINQNNDYLIKSINENIEYIENESNLEFIENNLKEFNDNNNIKEIFVEGDLVDLFSNKNWLNIQEIKSNQKYSIFDLKQILYDNRYKYTTLKSNNPLDIELTKKYNQKVEKLDTFLSQKVKTFKIKQIKSELLDSLSINIFNNINEKDKNNNFKFLEYINELYKIYKSIHTINKSNLNYKLSNNVCSTLNNKYKNMCDISIVNKSECQTLFKKKAQKKKQQAQNNLNVAEQALEYLNSLTGGKYY